ncbi:recombinase family protein [Oscillochloris sp. ZM17-4]|uniref:recombinase family protein n=1 Tax=Oscillochloris sp. ZM17-4 TaxID=2866714 RepID=UPI001C73CAC4|nr:recombinase family protein [Oscillochloris sp. ZM17-4]MBX0328680.1 recombinase family protein [Oscillochloris sp. ZM17-4]
MARAAPRTQAPAAPPPMASVAVGIYIRVSTDEQAASGFGLEVQRTQTTGMAMVKGYHNTTVYEDAGLSGTLGAKQRPGLARLLADVQAGKIQVVVIAALDRLGRSTRIILDVVEQITSGGAQLISARESLDTTTPTGQFMLTIFAALAQLERDQIVKRTADGREARGRKDGEKGGNLPLGYRRADGRVSVDQSAAAVVRRVFTLRQMFSLNSIAGTFNSEGVPTPHGGKVWYASTIRQILLNEAMYRGAKRGESSAAWPVILDGTVASPRRRRPGR